jgi:hypothetical protein
VKHYDRHVILFTPTSEWLPSIEDYEEFHFNIIKSLNEIQLLAPIPRPRRNIFCVGKNYFEHAKEFGTSGYDSSTSKPGDEIPKPYIQERQSTKASIRKGATAAAEVLLGRGLSEEQLNEIYKKAVEREKSMPVVTKYARAKGGGVKATTTGGADTEEFLYQEIAKTDEAKQNKIFGLYDAFKTAIGVK